MLRLYDSLSSGNAYKVRLLLRQLGRKFERIEMDIDRGDTRTDEFLRINPNGRVPVLEIEPGVHLAESNAILWYLAEGTAYLPDGRLQRAQALQWMFFEQYSHEPSIAVARRWLSAEPKEMLEEKRALIPHWHAQGNAALAVMETHLRRNDWFAGGAYSLADIALYGYTHCADQGGFELSRYKAVRAWLDRIAAQPKHVRMNESW